MKVVSFVPSWTETLIWAGVDVVGRTRFCVHPAATVKGAKVIGGTKEANWDMIFHLQPDLVLMDQEENTKEMADNCKYPLHVTHVTSAHDMPEELRKMAVLLKNQKLLDLSRRWEKVLTQKPKEKVTPALIDFVKNTGTKEKIIYVIWRNPWMAASANTFIGSICKWLGWDLWGEEKYPKFLPTDFDHNALFLCSSEPYPFAKRREVLTELPGDVALVDGEKISWFGVRSLEYLESLV